MSPGLIRRYFKRTGREDAMDEDEEMWIGPALRIGSKVIPAAVRGAARLGRNKAFMSKAGKAFGYGNDAINVFNAFKKRKEEAELMDEDEDMYSPYSRYGRGEAE